MMFAEVLIVILAAEAVPTHQPTTADYDKFLYIFGEMENVTTTTVLPPTTVETYVTTDEPDMAGADLTAEAKEKTQNIDQGQLRYQIDFSFRNYQDISTDYNDSCYVDYMACFNDIGQRGRSPVCSYNDESQPSSVAYHSFETWCDMFFENCRKGMRFWRPYGSGYCFRREKVLLQKFLEVISFGLVQFNDRLVFVDVWP